jgi:hypothetical protein
MQSNIRNQQEEAIRQTSDKRIIREKNQIKPIFNPNQTESNQRVRPNQMKPNRIEPNQMELNQTELNKPI